MNGMVHANPPNPALEGRNLIDLRDANGKAVTREMIGVLETHESGWVDYAWPKPGGTEPSKKWGYVKRVEVGNDTFIVGAGFYAE